MRRIFRIEIQILHETQPQVTRISQITNHLSLSSLEGGPATPERVGEGGCFVGGLLGRSASHPDPDPPCLPSNFPLLLAYGRLQNS